jgi:hypothetical protein
MKVMNNSGEWSVFMLSVRTNNDCEGWHRRLNVQARRGTLPFYTLIALLHEEARLVQLYYVTKPRNIFLASTGYPDGPSKRPSLTEVFLYRHPSARPVPTGEKNKTRLNGPF